MVAAVEWLMTCCRGACCAAEDGMGFAAYSNIQYCFWQGSKVRILQKNEDTSLKSLLIYLKTNLRLLQLERTRSIVEAKGEPKPMFYFRTLYIEIIKVLGSYSQLSFLLFTSVVIRSFDTWTRRRTPNIYSCMDPDVDRALTYDDKN
jgi:hypothetical protein